MAVCSERGGGNLAITLPAGQLSHSASRPIDREVASHRVFVRYLSLHLLYRIHAFGSLSNLHFLHRFAECCGHIDQLLPKLEHRIELLAPEAAVDMLIRL